MDRRRMPNPSALAMPAWLLREAMHPGELGRRLRRSGKQRHIRYTRSSLYMVVEQVTRAGFIVDRETGRDGQPPERTVMGADGAFVTDLIQSHTAPGYVTSWQETMGSRT